MKIKLTVFVFLLATLDTLFAQDSVHVSRYRPGIMWYNTGLKPARFGAPKYDRFLFELGHSTAFIDSEKANTKWYSPNWNAQFIFDIPFVNKGIASLGVGLGIGQTRFSMEREMHFDKDMQFAGFGFVANTSALRSSALFIPVELRLRTPGWKHVKVHIGGRVSYAYSTKYLLELDDAHSLQKTKINEGSNKLLYSVHARLGIRNWAFFASYTLNPYLKSKYYDLTGLNMGLTISWY